MSMYFGSRRKLTLSFILLLLLFVFASISTSSSLALGWFVLLVLLLMLFVVDLMFMSDNTFVYEPNYSAWKAKTNS